MAGARKTVPFANTRSKISQPVVASFMAGGIAGAVSRTVVSPLERLKILFQVQSVGREEYKMSVPKALAKMWREEGFRGFMAGNGTNCVRIVPYSAVQFGAYNIYKKVSRLSNVLLMTMAKNTLRASDDFSMQKISHLNSGSKTHQAQSYQRYNDCHVARLPASPQ